jgi:Na+-driven multidrug efflux pump
VGKGLGAPNPEHAERAVWLAGHMNLVFLGSFGISEGLFVAITLASSMVALVNAILFRQGRWKLNVT